jgi:hypothetical protein
MGTQYYLMNGVKGQPHSNLRVKIIDDQNGGNYVLVQVCDMRLMDCPQSITERSNLTLADFDADEIDQASFELYNHNDTFLGEFDTLEAAKAEAAKYTRETGNETSIKKVQ